MGLFEVPLNDSICENAYYGIIPGDASHKIALFPEAGDYVGLSDGVEINNPDLDIMRVMEGQINGGATNHDGRVVNWNQIIPMCNLTPTQETYLDNFAKIILGGTGFNDYFSKTDSPITETFGDYEEGLAGINWEDTGNTTECWNTNLYDNNGSPYVYMVAGGNTESAGEMDTFHEMMNYMYPESVFSEESPASPSAGNYTINDPLAVQYKRDVDQAKFQNRWYTGEVSDLRINVDDFP